GLRADAGRTQDGRGRERIVQSPVLRLSRAAAGGSRRSREIAVLMALDPTATAAGVGLVTHTAIDSTNAECLRLARAGERGPLWVAAQIQTAGRGRRGRTWVSEPGNLFASLLMTDAGPPERLSELCFVAGVSVYDAICDAVRAARPDATLDQSGQLALKWPND